MLFCVRRHTGADGSFEWYVLNGHPVTVHCDVLKESIAVGVCYCINRSNS